jgi:hypothetical protein
VAVDDQRATARSDRAQRADDRERVRVVDAVDRREAARLAERPGIDGPALDGVAARRELARHEVLRRGLCAAHRGAAHQPGGELELLLEALVDGPQEALGERRREHARLPVRRS